MKQKAKIYFTSDIHGYFYPETYADREIRPLGLFAVMQDFKKDGNTLVLDGGDILQGSAFDMYCQKFEPSPRAQAEAVNAAGYDFVTIGNHDFNYGYDYLLGYIRALQARVVCANLRIKKPEDAALVQPYHIVTLENGLRVAVIGIVTDYVNVWEQKKNLEFFEVSDPYAALSKALSEIGDRADLRVCIYHGGYEEDLESGKVLSTTGEDIACRICRTLPLDVLLTGHQHMPMSGKWIEGTFTAQVPDKARQYLKMEIEAADKILYRTECAQVNETGNAAVSSKKTAQYHVLKRENGAQNGEAQKQQKSGISGIFVKSELCAPREEAVQAVAEVMQCSLQAQENCVHGTAEQDDRQFHAAKNNEGHEAGGEVGSGQKMSLAAVKKLMPLEEKVQTWLDQPLGHLSEPLMPDTKIRMAVNGSPIADFINQIQLEASGAQLACCGLANEVGGFRTDVTTRDVIASYPYPNTLVVLEISGAALKQGLERTAEYFQPDADAPDGIRVADSFIKPKVEHYNYDYFAGLFYVIDARRPAGERIVSMQYQGREIQPDDTFTLCMNNYRSSGAGGYEMYQGLKVLKEINTEMTEIIIDYLEKHPVCEVTKEKAYRVEW